MYSYEGAGACVAVVNSEPKGDVKRWNGGATTRVLNVPLGPTLSSMGRPWVPEMPGMRKERAMWVETRRESSGAGSRPRR